MRRRNPKRLPETRGWSFTGGHLVAPMSSSSACRCDEPELMKRLKFLARVHITHKKTSQHILCHAPSYKCELYLAESLLARKMQRMLTVCDFLKSHVQFGVCSSLLARRLISDWSKQHICHNYMLSATFFEF